MPSSNVLPIRPLPPHSDEYPEKVKDTVRPFRLWDSAERKVVAHRCYATERRAHDMAFILLRWERKVGRAIEVIDIRFGRWLGTYVRRVNAVQFDPNRNPQ